MGKAQSKRSASELKAEVAAFKRQRIVEEASHLFFLRGYEATTLDAVAEQLRVTKPFIYSYCRNKSELLFEICQIGIKEAQIVLDDALASPGSAQDRLKLLVDKLVHVIIANQEYLVVYQREEKNLDAKDARAIREMRRNFDLKLAQLLEEGRKARLFDFDDASRTAIWISGLVSWIANWYHPGGHWSESEVAMDAMRIIMKIVAPKPKS